MSQALRERAIGMLTARMSTRAVACEFYINFSTISRLQRHFRDFDSTSNRPHNRRPRVTTPAQELHIQHFHLQDRLRPATRTAAATIGLHNQRISAQTVRNHLVSGKLICMLVIFIGVSTWLQFVVVTDLSGQMPIFDGIWHFVEVLFMDESRFSLYRADGRQRVWRCVVMLCCWCQCVYRVAHRGGGVMVWACLCYEQRTQVHFIDGILYAQWYHDEILRPIVLPFIHDHHLMLQHDIARPHVARICIQFLEDENIPVLVWPQYSPDMSPTEHVWDALDRRIWQCVPIPANIQQLCTAIEEEWTNIPQATINNLINSMRRRCIALCEANYDHTRYWLVFEPTPHHAV